MEKEASCMAIAIVLREDLTRSPPDAIVGLLLGHIKSEYLMARPTNHLYL